MSIEIDEDITTRQDGIEVETFHSELQSIEQDRSSATVVTGSGQLGTCPVPWRNPLKFLFWCGQLLFGLASLVLMLAVIAAIPLVNFLALGYLLEVERRVSLSGRLRDAFPWLRDAPRIGALALGVWLWLLPLRLLSLRAADAHLIDPSGPVDLRWHLLLDTAWVLITIHLILAIGRGGSLSCFFRPLKNLRWMRKQLRTRGSLRRAGDEVKFFLDRLKLRKLFWLGLGGFVVAFIWLVIPTALYAAIQEPRGERILLMLIGGVLLTFVLKWAPFLQARFATEGRFRAGLELREVRQLGRYAPLAWLLAITTTYTLALPLYLFKAFLLPPDAMWPITLIFIVSIYPAKIVIGWAYHAAVRRRESGASIAHWSLRWLGGTLSMAILAAYVFLLYFTQFISEAGKMVLYQHHALLLPVPF